MTLALADGEMDAAEQRALDRIGHLLGFRATQIAQLLRMAQAQGQFHHAPGSQGSITRVEVAYEALGGRGHQRRMRKSSARIESS